MSAVRNTASDDNTALKALHHPVGLLCLGEGQPFLTSTSLTSISASLVVTTIPTVSALRPKRLCTSSCTTLQLQLCLQDPLFQDRNGYGRLESVRACSFSCHAPAVRAGSANQCSAAPAAVSIMQAPPAAAQASPQVKSSWRSQISGSKGEL
jgi:hypothetical protein